MIKFRNPSTSPHTQFQIFKELYKEYRDIVSFDLEDMTKVMTKEKLMTAYGYSGDDAISLSDTENESLNSVKMNAKMTAEVFRMLGWVASIGKKAYPITFTFLGEHVAQSDDILSIYEQSILGINNPQEIMNVKYNEKVRISTSILRSLVRLDDVMYKHEFCIGPMSVNDIEDIEFDNMISYISSIRGDYRDLVSAFDKLCVSLKMKKTPVDNSTRLPVSFLKTCGWVEVDERNRNLYPPKALKCLKITTKGRDVLEMTKTLKDLRLDEFNRYSEDIQDSLIRLGMYHMLERAGFDTTPVNDIIVKDEELCSSITGSKKLLFSPYQTLNKARVDDALSYTPDTKVENKAEISISSTLSRVKNKVKHVEIEKSMLHGLENCNTQYDLEFIGRVRDLDKLYSTYSNKEQLIAEKLFAESETMTQKHFYPLIETLFKIMGLDCKYSRQGDNGARWDAIIIDNERSIPIEIKSPTEEIHISVKAIKQALENKIILLSRKTYNTTPETSSLVVGYKVPNERAEVSEIIENFKNVYGYKIGVLGLEALLTNAVHCIINKKVINTDEIYGLEGIINVIA